MKRRPADRSRSRKDVRTELCTVIIALASEWMRSFMPGSSAHLQAILDFHWPISQVIGKHIERSKRSTTPPGECYNYIPVYRSFAPAPIRRGQISLC